MTGQGYEVEKRGVLFYVIGAEGQRLGMGYLLRADAEAGVESLLRPAKRSFRACMSCRRPFESEGIHNRLCGQCKRRGTG